MIQTPGGLVDAAEKIISVLHQSINDLRVIVPSWAKSAGTIIALSSKSIVLGMTSELGPIDPQWQTPAGPVPCELIASDPKIAPHLQQMALLAVERAKELAKKVLKRGMLSSVSEDEIDAVLGKISSSAGYKSHGAVIDYDEATQLGLSVEYLAPDNETWKRFWMLYCMYDYDSKEKNLGKIIEGNYWSIARPK